MSSIVEFNAQMYVSEQLTRQLVNTTQDVAIRCVNVLAEKYNFDADEAIRVLGLNMIKLERKAPEKVKTAVTVKVTAPKSAFPLPYNGEFNDACCYALRQNNGLYTQCTGVRKGEAHFCNGCASQMQKTGAEMPEYGTIQQRMAVGIMEYVDPKGRKPIAYAKIMKKYKIDEEQVLAEAGKFNIVINPIHFVVAETEGKRGRPKAEKEPKEKGTKGRPKKSKKVLQIEGDDEDLFAALVAEANDSDSLASQKKKSKKVIQINDDDEDWDLHIVAQATEVEGEEVVMSGKKKGKSEEEKEAERLQKEAEKQAKKEAAEKAKAEKEAKLAAEKAEKEAKLAAEKEARAAKKAAEEAEKQAKKEAAEKAKAEKEAKKKADEEARAEKKTGKKSEGKTKAAAEPEEKDEPDVVKKIEYEGKKYLVSKKTGIVYDYNKYMKEEEQVIIGKYDFNSKKLEFADTEEEEDEYDD